MIITRKLSLLLLLLVAALPSFAKDSPDVLFIGNSYTKGISATISELYAQSDHKHAKLNFIHPGGKTLGYHLENEKTPTLINGGEFDVVVLQDHSQAPAVFPKQFLEAAEGLNKLVLANKGTVVFYQTWGRRDGDPHNQFKDFTAMQKVLTKSYAKAAKSLNAKVAPVGEAWQIVHDTKPDLFTKLYQKDGSHPSKHGAYLAAFTIFSTINDVDATTIKWDADLPAEEASTLRQAAATAIHNQR